MAYKFRAAPARFRQGMPAIVDSTILDIYAFKDKGDFLCFDVFMRETISDNVTGLDFFVWGARGCHFELRPHEFQQYRDANRRKRIAWQDLPQIVKTAIQQYAEWNPD